MKFNPNDYATVEERLTEFWNEHPDGRVWTNLERMEPPLVVFRAEVYRDASDAHPAAVGYAYEKEGAGPVNKTSYVENCETSAIGRALANLGLHGKKGAPRPSREEMEKVQRMEKAQRMEERGKDIAFQVNELLSHITDADMEQLDPKTKTGVVRLRAAHAAGEVETMERGLEFLRKTVKVVQAGHQLEGEEAA